MRLPLTRLRYTGLFLCAVLLLAGAWAFCNRLKTSTKAKSALVIQSPTRSSPPALQPTPLAGVKPPSLQTPLAIAMPVGESSAATNTLPLLTVPPPYRNPALNDLEMASLRSRGLVIPVQGTTAPQILDTFTQARAGGVPHDALDIMAPRGTPVLAVENGRTAKLFLSKAGGITLYQFDPDSRYAYYYAHLDGYADGVTEGSSVRKGQVIGYVGSTGNASPAAPHLHFAIFRLEPERQWWRGTPLNPYLVWREAKP